MQYANKLKIYTDTATATSCGPWYERSVGAPSPGPRTVTYVDDTGIDIVGWRLASESDSTVVTVVYVSIYRRVAPPAGPGYSKRSNEGALVSEVAAATAPHASRLTHTGVVW